MSNPDFYERNLPHYQPSNGWYLVNFRLANSLPRHAVERIQQEFEDYKRALAATPPSAKKTSAHRERQFKYFLDFDKLLHEYANSPTWLSQNDVAQIVADAIHYYDKTQYDLSAFCIMPNHVHIVFGLGAALVGEDKLNINNVDEIPFPVTHIIGSIKKYTARMANEALHRGLYPVL